MEYFLGAYTTLDHDMFGDEVWRAVRDFLTKRSGMLVSPLAVECDIAFQKELPTCEGTSDLVWEAGASI